MADLSRPPGLAPHPDDPWRCHPPLPSVSPAAPLTYLSPPIPNHSLLIAVLTHSRRSSSSLSPRLSILLENSFPGLRSVPYFTTNTRTRGSTQARTRGTSTPSVLRQERSARSSFHCIIFPSSSNVQRNAHCGQDTRYKIQGGTSSRPPNQTKKNTKTHLAGLRKPRQTLARSLLEFFRFSSFPKKNFYFFYQI